MNNTAAVPVSSADDAFHFGDMSDRWWETETCWFSFHHPERALGGWLYVMARPNVGSVAGGCWIWDASAHLPWEIPYSSNLTCQRLPPDTDLRDANFTTGVSVRMVEPLQRYALGYEDGERLQLALTFDAVMAPAALTTQASGFGSLGHFDQFGRIHGEIVLHGERIPIDCLSMRDRSWGPRPEHRPRRTSYVTGICDAGHGFLALSNPDAPGDPIAHGFLLRDGNVQPWANGHRHVVACSRHGWTQEIHITATDVTGRVLRAHGRPASRVVINRHSFIDVNSLVRWDIDGREGWGEDQDCWPVHAWSAYRRARP